MELTLSQKEVTKQCLEHLRGYFAFRGIPPGGLFEEWAAGNFLDLVAYGILEDGATEADIDIIVGKVLLKTEEDVTATTAIATNMWEIFDTAVEDKIKEVAAYLVHTLPQKKRTEEEYIRLLKEGREVWKNVPLSSSDLPQHRAQLVFSPTGECQKFLISRFPSAGERVAPPDRITLWDLLRVLFYPLIRMMRV